MHPIGLVDTLPELPQTFLLFGMNQCPKYMCVSSCSQYLPVAQPLSDQIWVNRAFCGKSTKFGTHVHNTKKSKFSYSAKPDVPHGAFGGHFKKWPLCHDISETKRRRAIIVDSIGFLGRRFQKKYCQIHHAIVSAILEAIWAKWRTFTKK